MSKEYIIAEGTKPNGEQEAMLISVEAEFGIEDYFASGSTEIKETGRVQIMGDTDYLHEAYQAQ